MNSFRQSRFVAALIALFGMLFMQLAVASYACPEMKPGQAGGTVVMSADAADHGMADCQGMDMQQPNLCHAHDQADNLSLDKPGTPQIQSFVAIGLALASSPIDSTYRPTATPPEQAQLTRATAPPLSIRNCCFRL